MLKDKTVELLLDQARTSLSAFICSSEVSIESFPELGADIVLMGFAAHTCRVHDKIHIFSVEDAFTAIKDATNPVFYHVTFSSRSQLITEEEAQQSREYIQRFIKINLSSVIQDAKSDMARAKHDFRSSNPSVEMIRQASLSRAKQKEENRQKHLENVKTKKAKDDLGKLERKKEQLASNKKRKRKNRPSRFQDRLGLARGSALISHIDIDEENILEFYTCFRKKSYAFITKAKESVLRDHKNEINAMDIYICVYCTGYHVGHSIKHNGSRVNKNARSYWKAHPSDANAYVEMKKLLNDPVKVINK